MACRCPKEKGSSQSNPRLAVRTEAQTTRSSASSSSLHSQEALLQLPSCSTSLTVQDAKCCLGQEGCLVCYSQMSLQKLTSVSTD